MDRLSTSEQLMDRAWDLLRRRNPSEALKVAQQLEDMCFSGAFEIRALALSDLNKRREAIAELERGVGLAGNVWLLWQLLGNYRSDEGDYDGAFAAYDQALQSEPDIMSVEYNYANALARAGRKMEACARLERLLQAADLNSAEPPLAVLLLNLTEELLRGQGREEQADALLDRHAHVVARHALGR